MCGHYSKFESDSETANFFFKLSQIENIDSSKIVNANIVRKPVARVKCKNVLLMCENWKTAIS